MQAATETLTGSDSPTKNTDFAKTSFTVLGTYWPDKSNRTINSKSCLKVRWNQTNVSTGNEQGFALKVNTGYKITGLTAQMSGNGNSLTLSDIKIDGVAYSGSYTKTIPKNDEKVDITLSDIEATDYINFVKGSGDATQGYVYITVTYERIVATETYNFEKWTTADGVITKASGDGTTFDVEGVDADGTRNMTYASHITIGGVEHSFGGRLAFDSYSSGGSSFGWRFRKDAYAYKNGLVTQGKDPNWSPYYFSICNLNVGDIVKVTYSYQSGRDAQPYFVSANASTGGVAVVANETKMVSGTEYTITTAGRLDLVVKNNNFGMHKLEIIRPVTSLVESAIADIKSHENSRAFATYIDNKFGNGDLSTVADVYAAHTTWQIDNSVLTDGVRDITNVIRNAAVADGTNWGGASLASNEQYTGAPDNTYFDKNNGSINTNQTVYGVPAGVYEIKAATRAAAGTSGTLYANDGTSDVGKVDQINNVGNTGGTLGNGWSWSTMTFALTGTKNLLVGFWADASSPKWASCDDWHMYKIESVPVTITDAGAATLVSPYALDFTGIETVKAYYASKQKGADVTFTRIEGRVAANTPLYVTGTTTSVPVVATGDDVDDNLLVAGTGDAVESEADGKYNFILNKVDEEVGFYWANGKNVAVGKAYLSLPKDPFSGEAKSLNLIFDGETTGINDISRMNNNGESMNDMPIYNLSGQRIAAPQKGINIVNGKKFIVK